MRYVFILSIMFSVTIATIVSGCVTNPSTCGRETNPAILLEFDAGATNGQSLIPIPNGVSAMWIAAVSNNGNSVVPDVQVAFAITDSAPFLWGLASPSPTFVQIPQSATGVFINNVDKAYAVGISIEWVNDCLIDAGATE